MIHFWRSPLRVQRELCNAVSDLEVQSMQICSELHPVTWWMESQANNFHCQTSILIPSYRIWQDSGLLWRNQHFGQWEVIWQLYFCILVDIYGLKGWIIMTLAAALTFPAVNVQCELGVRTLCCGAAPFWQVKKAAGIEHVYWRRNIFLYSIPEPTAKFSCDQDCSTGELNIIELTEEITKVTNFLKGNMRSE